MSELTPLLDPTLPTQIRRPRRRVDVLPACQLQHIQRTAPRGVTSCIADVTVTSTGALNFPQLLLAAITRIEPGSGFPRQHHAGIELLTVMLSGTVALEDSITGRELVGSDDVTVLSTGSGVDHEDVALAGDPVFAVVFWVRSPAAPASYARRTIPRIERLNGLRLVASHDPPTPDVLAVNAPVTLHTGVLAVDVELTYQLPARRRAYVISTLGAITVDGVAAEAGDRVQIRGSGAVRIRAVQSTELVVLTA
jgi:redox-sensitive bicupin YhaK (pirin superfamily)